MMVTRLLQADTATDWPAWVDTVSGLSHLTLTVSWLITRSGPARYFFGLNTTNQSRIPGGTLGGFLPLTVMSILFGVATLLANVLNV